MDTPPTKALPFASRLGRWLMVSLLLANAAVLGIAVWTARLSLHHHHRQAEVTTRNVADTLERNLSGKIKLLDLTLVQVLEDPLMRQGAAPDPASLRLLMERHRLRLPLLAALRATDQEGHVIGGTLIEAPHPTTLADRPYFQELKKDPQAGLVVSPPVVSRFDRERILVFARARRDGHGAFAGIVYGVVPLETFTRTLGIVDVGPHGSIAVRDAFHGLVTRYPNTTRLEARLGERAQTPEYFQVVQSREGVGTFRKPSPVDGLVRTWTVRRVTEHPFWLVVGLAEQDYLADWRREALITGTLAVGWMAVSLLLGLLTRRLWRRQELIQQELAHEKEKFQVLTEQTEEVIWSVSPEGRFTYVSPAIQTQSGFAPEEVLGLPVEAMMATSEGAAFLSEQFGQVRAASPGSQPFPQGLELEQRRKDGSTFPAESRFTVLWGPDGGLRGIRGITRDVSERKRIQGELEGLIHDLTMALAEVKALRGMLPICSGCKKIRDDQGYWNQIESYLTVRTDATFTHGMCPECVARYFPEMAGPKNPE